MKKFYKLYNDFTTPNILGKHFFIINFSFIILTVVFVLLKASNVL